MKISEISLKDVKNYIHVYDDDDDDFIKSVMYEIGRAHV